MQTFETLLISSEHFLPLAWRQMATSEVVKPVSPLFPLGQIGLLISEVFDRAAFAKVFAYLFALVFVFAFEVLFKLSHIVPLILWCLTGHFLHQHLRMYLY